MPSEVNFTLPTFIDVNSRGDIIGTYQSKDNRKCCFIYLNGKAVDLNIDDFLLAQGYQFININPKKINNTDCIIGYFDYGYKHPLKNNRVIEGSLSFFSMEYRFIYLMKL